MKHNMILRPGYYYTFFKVDKARYKNERDDKIKYPYIGEILSDSWGDGEEPKDRLLWDEDVNSGDFWEYDQIYPELLELINKEIKQGFEINITETVSDPDVAANDYIISDPNVCVIKLSKEK